MGLVLLHCGGVNCVVCPIGTPNVICVGVCVALGSSGGRPAPPTPCSGILGGW